MSEVQKTRAEVDLMALQFLRDGGPHTMGPIENEEAMCALLVFIDLKKDGLVTSTDFGGGNVQWSLTAAGSEAAA